ELLDTAKAALQRIETGVADADHTMSAVLPADMSPERLDAWLTSRELALETMAALRAAERDRDAASSDGDAHLQRIKAALDAAGIPYAPNAEFEQLVAVAQASVDQASEIRQLRREF